MMMTADSKSLPGSPAVAQDPWSSVMRRAHCTPGLGDRTPPGPSLLAAATQYHNTSCYLPTHPPTSSIMSWLIELWVSISYTVPQHQLLSTYPLTYVQYNVLADRTPPDSSLLDFASPSGVRTAQRTARLQSISYTVPQHPLPQHPLLSTYPTTYFLADRTPPDCRLLAVTPASLSTVG